MFFVASTPISLFLKKKEDTFLIGNILFQLERLEDINLVKFIGLISPLLQPPKGYLSALCSIQLTCFNYYF